MYSLVSAIAIDGGIAFVMKKERIIVSLTSYPKRIKWVSQVIKTLLIQTLKPDLIILWLAEEQFIDGEKNLPEDLLELRKYGLEIRWCDDLKPHKKYFYVMQEFRDDIIITVDDDVYYSPRLVEVLYASYEKFPDSVSCMVANRIVLNEKNQVCAYEEWIKNERLFKEIPMIDLMPVGFGGVLYPPHILGEETFNKQNILQFCPFQDDIWLKVMEVMRGIHTVVANGNLPYPETVMEAQECGLYNTINITANDVALKNIERYLDQSHNAKNTLITKLNQGKKSCVKMHSEKEINEHYDSVLREMLQKGFYIYGAGYGAQIVMDCLQELDNALLPIAFIVTNKNGNPETLFGRPVMELDCLKNELMDRVIIISTDESKQSDIKKALNDCKANIQLCMKDSVMGRIIHGKKEIEEYKNRFSRSLLQ